MIYIACLPAFATGGTELLHQFGAELLKNGVEASMLYHHAKGDPVAPRFKKYNVPYVLGIETVKPGDVLVAPEVLTDLLYEWKGIRKVVWWLSIDFFFRSRFSKRNLFRRLFLQKKFFNFNDTGVDHFVQSRYAFDFLSAKGIVPAGMLSDYLGDDFIQAAISAANASEKKPVVLFNPKKGIKYTRKLIALLPGVEFRAIENMTPAEVANLMQTSALYIDFGNHPGKDRIPREAAISGACVIVGKQGSATNAWDVPVPDMFKFDLDDAGLRSAVVRIQEIVEQPSKYQPMFDHYRNVIIAEKSIFQQQVVDFILKIKLQS